MSTFAASSTPHLAAPRSRVLRGLIAGALALLAVVVSAMSLTSSAKADQRSSRPFEEVFTSRLLVVPFAGTRWIPQGLSTVGTDKLVVSYYDEQERRPSRIALVDRRAGYGLTWFSLDIVGHVGGIAVTRSYLWVTDETDSGPTLRRYLRTDLERVEARGTLHAGAVFPVEAESYAFAEGESIWVGRFDPSRDSTMYRYDVRDDGTLSPYSAALSTPAKVQGVAVTDDEIIWSLSYGREHDGTLVYWPRSVPWSASTDVATGVGGISLFLTTSSQSEGLALAHGNVYVLFESCAHKYFNGAKDSMCGVRYGPVRPQLGA